MEQKKRFVISVFQAALARREEGFCTRNYVMSVKAQVQKDELEDRRRTLAKERPIQSFIFWNDLKIVILCLMSMIVGVILYAITHGKNGSLVLGLSVTCIISVIAFSQFVRNTFKKPVEWEEWFFWSFQKEYPGDLSWIPAHCFDKDNPKVKLTVLWHCASKIRFLIATDLVCPAVYFIDCWEKPESVPEPVVEAKSS